MATRFYFTRISSGASYSTGAGWEDTISGNLVRLQLLRKTALPTLSTLTDTSSTVPITTTQDILNAKFVSDPIPPQRIIGTVSLVIRCSEDATTTNATLAVQIRVLSQDLNTQRGILFSNFDQDTEFALTASAATRIVNAQAVTELTTQPGDRIAVEMGVHATAPSVAGSAVLRYGTSAATDFALTSGLTTDLNPWIEFSQDIWDADLNNYQFVKVGDGMSTTEKIR